MLTMLRQRRDEDEGFTLIELMVVVLIIAILIAIAIPTFLGAQDRARDRGAQSDLRNAITAAKTLATDNAGLFLDTSATPVAIDAADMLAAEPSLTFVAMASASATQIGVATEATGLNIVLLKKSASNTWFGITATSQGVVRYCKGAAATDCDAADDTAYTTKW
jgi:type IV pilus assembly protein PilA